jgi:hypothetical protein
MSSNQSNDKPVSLYDSTPPGLRYSLMMIFFSLVGFFFFRILLMQTGWMFFFSLYQISTLTFFAGLIILIMWLFKYFVLSIVKKEQVVERWALLIRDGNEHAPEIVQNIKTLILASKAPNITMEQKDVAPSIIRGVFGGRRPFLLISDTTNANLKRYRMYLNARDYGNNLQVCWYVIYHRPLGELFLKILLFVPGLNLVILPIYVLAHLPKAGEAGLVTLDFFDLQDLTAYVTNAHHCVLDAVDVLLLELSQDPSKIERKSQGFLGIS